MEFITIKESLSIYRSETKNPLLIPWKANYMYFFQHLVRIVKVIDLSSNFLTQGIPVEIAKLVELNSLNLSRNQLMGSIPSNISELKILEIFDLSRNRLSCAIPTSMVSMTFLSYFNLSYNTLGKFHLAISLLHFGMIPT